MPYRVVVLNSACDPDEVHRRLKAFVSPGSILWGTAKRLESGERAEFVGTVKERSFKIGRHIEYRNSFLPILRGRIEARPEGGSRVRILMTLNIFIALFMGVWLTFAAFGVIGSRTRGVVQTAAASLMFAAGLGMCVGGFFYEARKSEAALRRRLDAPRSSS